MIKIRNAINLILLGSCISSFADSGKGWVSYAGGTGPGAGKHIVLLAGDEEYRSEASLPMLAKILSERHGFKTTVLFSTDADGSINPNAVESLNEPATLDSADALVIGLRFRQYPDEVMKKFDAAIQRGVPVVGIRTSTHAFKLPDTSIYKSYNSFGKEVLGEGWVDHWSKQGHEGTQGVIEPESVNHPVLKGVVDVFCDTGVYEVHPSSDSTILIRSQILTTMEQGSAPAQYQKKRSSDQQMQGINDPMMPVAWSRESKNSSGKTNKIVCTTMGSAFDLRNEDLRRFLVNGVFWGLGLEVPEKADVTPLGGDYKPPGSGFDQYVRGIKAADHELK